MKKLILLALFAVFSAGVHAEATKVIQYDGQNSDSFELDLETQITRYREEQYQSTCERQIPYTERVCGYETRYRQECRTEPGYQQCRTVNDQVCRNVTRTRRECSRGPDRRVCTTVPNMVCRQVDGRRVCSQQGTRQQCRNEPGPQTCRDVPYTDRVCTNNPRRVCDWIPPRQVCNSVPYQEYICRDVTRYRTETYACTRTRQVPYNVDRENVADVLVDYNDQNADGSLAKLVFALNKEGEVSLDVSENSTPASLVFVTKKQNVTNSDDNLSTDANYKITFVSKDAYLAPVKNEVTVSTLDQNHLVLRSAKLLRPQDLRIQIDIKKKGILGIGSYKFSKVLKAGQFTTAKTQDFSFIDIDFGAIGAKVKDGKKYEFTVTIHLEADQTLVTPINESTNKTIHFKKKI